MALSEVRTAPEKPRVQTSRPRNERIDFWRGLCIVGMVSWHLLTDPSYPKWFSFGIIQAFNFVAEGFVLLAGLSVGLVASRSTTMSRYLRRAGEILILHYAMVAALVAGHRAGIIGDLAPAPPDNGLLGACAGLQYQPYLADVLTIFVFLFALSPLLIWFRRRAGAAWLLAASLGAYALANLAHVPGISPEWTILEPNRHGAFDVGSWQLVYVLGMLLGERFDAVQASALRQYARLWPLLLALFVGAAAFRLAAEMAGSGIDVRLRTALFDRHPLGPARLVYILLQLALIALFTVRYWERIETRAPVRAIVLLGRCSLLIFVVSVFADYLLKTAITRLDLAFPVNIACWWLEIAILLIVAYWAAHRRALRAAVS